MVEMDVLKSLSSLQFELEAAKNGLKNVDENIKKIIGRDPSDQSRINKKKVSVEDKVRVALKLKNRIRNNTNEFGEPKSKKRNNDYVVKRLSTVEEDVHHDLQKQIISKVIVTPKEVPSREDALEAQNKDEKFKARNKRIFGALLGTLQKFQQEETKLRPREEKRAQLEKKIEEHETKEKEELKKERYELFLNRKQKQMEIKIIELKLSKIREYTAWVEYQKSRKNFILTKTDPHIHYLPRKLNDKTTDLLHASKSDIQTIIEKRSLKISEDLKYIEDKMRGSFRNKNGLKGASQNKEIFSLENHNSEDHLENIGEVIEESAYTKSDINVVSELSTELDSFGKEYNGNIQDKENNQSITTESQGHEPSDSVESQCKPDNNCEDI